MLPVFSALSDDPVIQSVVLKFCKWHGVLSQLCELLAEKPLLVANVLDRNSSKSFWVPFSNCYQCFGRTARLPTTLFPILQGAH